MKDLMKMANEANEKARSKKEETELFTDSLLEELKKMKGTDISPYLSCEYDVIHRQYVVTLRIPSSADVFNTGRSDRK